MAVEKIVIEVSGKDDLNSTIKDVEKLGAADAANAAIFKKTNEEYKRASIEREKRIKEETQDLNELRQAKKKAFSVEDIDAYNNRIRETEKRIETLKDKTGKAGSFMKNQFAAVGATIAGAFAVTQLISFGKEAINLAAKGEGIRRAFAALNRADLLDNLRAATRNTVADIDLMAAAVKANNFKIPLEDLARYFKFAQQRARETGESVDYLVESIVLGIGRKSPLILDNLGISAVELRSKLKGIGTESATVGQISQAVGQIIDEELGKQGVLLDTTADKLARLSAGWQNFKESAGSALVSTYDAIAGTFGAGSDASEKFIKETIERNNLLYKNLVDINAAIGQDYENAAQKAVDRQNELKRAREKDVDTVGVLLERIKALQEEYKDVSTPEQYAAITAKIKTVQEQLEKIIGKTTDKIKEQKKAIEDSGLAEYAANVRAGLEAGYKAEADLLQAGKDKEAEIAAAALKDRLEMDDKLAENEKNNQEEVTANLEAEMQQRYDLQQVYMQGVEQLTSELFNMISQSEQSQTQAFLTNLDYKLRAGEISDEQYANQRKAFLKKQAEDERSIAIFQATIKAALAVINAITTGDPYTAAARAAVAAAIGAAEVIAISSAPLPQFEKGGQVKGKSHREGGVHAELEGDEFVISKKAARKIGFDNLEMLNKGIVPPKLLKQGITQRENNAFQNRLIQVLGSSQDFDTYNIEKLLKKSISTEKEVAKYIVKGLSGNQQKRTVLK